MGLPREGVSYSDTWVNKMKQAYPQHDFVSCFRRGMLIKDAVGYYDFDYKNYDADGYIMQTGVCDCSPRYINDNKFFWKSIVGIVKKLRIESYFWGGIKSIFNRSPNCVYTSPQDFHHYLDILLTNLIEKGKFVILIKIGKASPSVLNKNPYMNKKVDEYNTIIDDIVKNKENRVIAIDPLNNVSEDYFVDGYHCNANGMEIVFNSINKAFKTFLNQ